MYGRGPDTPSVRSGKQKHAGEVFEPFSAEVEDLASLLPPSLYV